MANNNIKPIKSFNELNGELDYVDFEYKDYFELLCKLKPDKENEKLEILDLDAVKKNETGFIYIFVIDGKIFKIGQSTTSIKDRVSSYNCGKTQYRISGTNSTTNYYVLQSLINIGKTVDVYAFFPPLAKYNLFGVDIESSEAPSKCAERKIIEDFIKNHKKKPIGCSQK